MMIKEFCEKYGVSRRSVDYWTNLGLLHPDSVNPENGYRDYGERAEKEIMDILLVRMLNNGHVSRKALEELSVQSDGVVDRVNAIDAEQRGFMMRIRKYTLDRFGKGG